MTAIVANGGTEVNPKLILDEKQEYERQLVSEDTAKKVDSMLEDVMTKGTGKGAESVFYGGIYRPYLRSFAGCSGNLQY